MNDSSSRVAERHMLEFAAKGGADIMIKYNHNGTTLLEFIIAVSIIVILAGVGVSGFLKQMEKGKMDRRIAQAQTVFRAIEIYLDDTATRGTIDDFSLYEEIMVYPVCSEKNKLSPYLKNICPEDMKITRLAINKSKTKVTAIVCKTEGWQIEIRDGWLDEYSKIQV